MDDHVAPRIYSKNVDQLVDIQEDDIPQRPLRESKVDDLGRHHFVIPEGKFNYGFENRLTRP